MDRQCATGWGRAMGQGTNQETTGSRVEDSVMDR